MAKYNKTKHLSEGKMYSLSIEDFYDRKGDPWCMGMYDVCFNRDKCRLVQKCQEYISKLYK